MPNATSIQLLLLLPMKKESLVLFLPVYQATPSKMRKYAITKEKSNNGDIWGWLSDEQTKTESSKNF